MRTALELLMAEIDDVALNGIQFERMVDALAFIKSKAINLLPTERTQIEQGVIYGQRQPLMASAEMLASAYYEDTYPHCAHVSTEAP